MLTLLAAFGVSQTVCHLIVRSAGWHLHYTGDQPGAQVQKFHTRAVPRVGGLGVLLGIVVAGLLLPLPKAELELFWLLILSLMPAFIGGFLEDITRRVGPGVRLLLTVITAGFAFSLAGVHFERSDVGWLDKAMTFLPVAYLMLLFAVAGVAHAINIIDGYHGLAGGVAIIILGAMGYVAYGSGDALVGMFCFISAWATMGFLLLNYPSGRLFLGDGGAYLLGCVIALAAALLIQRNPEISPWFPMALVIYPVWETLFSVARRVLLYRTRIGEADARHLHSLVYRRIAWRWVRGHTPEGRDRRNYLTTLPFWFACLLVAGFAVTWSGSTRALGLLVIAFIVGYCVLYWRLARLAVPVGRKLAGSLKSPLPAERGEG